jgi:hypothetical protein
VPVDGPNGLRTALAKPRVVFIYVPAGPIADAGVDVISVVRITHSAPSLDLALAVSPRAVRRRKSPRSRSRH